MIKIWNTPLNVRAIHSDADQVSGLTALSVIGVYHTYYSICRQVIIYYDKNVNLSLSLVVVKLLLSSA